MQLHVDRESQIPVYLQIARQLRRSILNGEPPKGGRLTPERRLAKLLGVNRTTVVNAYRELAADGLVSGQVGRGTIVVYDAGGARSPSLPVEEEPPPREWDLFSEDEPQGVASVPWAQLFTPVTDVMDDPLLRDAMTVAARPDVVRFATGTPAPELYPVQTIRDLFAEALDASGQTLLQHTPTEGFPPLREQLASWMERGAAAAGTPAPVSPRDVVVVAGSQQGLYLLARTLIDPGDLVAVESPTYLGAIQVFRAAGARLLPIPVDRDGMQVDLLQDVVTRRKPKLIYTLPTFQNPSGTVMSVARRARLLDLAARHGIPVIEDDPYAALRYDGRALPSLFALDRYHGGGSTRRTSAEGGCVIYLSTVSKMLFPGFRIGWIAAPRVVLERVTLMKQLVDLDTNQLAQWVVWAFFERGLFDAHLQRVNALYPRRRDLMLDALARHAGGLIEAERPEGGIYLWCRLHDGLRVRDLLPEAAREGVVFAPGESFHIDASTGRGRTNMRLNFTYPAEAAIEEGARRLGVALARLAERADLDLRHPRPEDELTPIV